MEAPNVKINFNLECLVQTNSLTDGKAGKIDLGYRLVVVYRARKVLDIYKSESTSKSSTNCISALTILMHILIIRIVITHVCF